MLLYAGRHIHHDDAALVLGRNAYYDNSLNNKRAYLASDWGRRSVAFAGACTLTVRTYSPQDFAISALAALFAYLYRLIFLYAK
jgi:hypothetical protein